MQEKFPGVRYAFEGEQKDQADSMREMTIGFFGALVGMYVLMAIPLRSYIQPLIVMSVIPFGLVGAVIGHILMGMESEHHVDVRDRRAGRGGGERQPGAGGLREPAPQGGRLGAGMPRNWPGRRGSAPSC